MSLNLSDGAVCFIDANILYYHFVQTSFSEACSDFLSRVSDGRLTGYTSVHVLAEAVHKIMLAEAAARFNLKRAGLVGWMQRHQPRIMELEQFHQAAESMAAMGLKILSPSMATLTAAAGLSRQYGLLTNDAITVALMRQHNIRHLVSNDSDFKTVADLILWQP